MKTLTLKQIAKMLGVSEGRASHALHVLLIKYVEKAAIIDGAKLRTYDKKQVEDSLKMLKSVIDKIDKPKIIKDYRQSRVNEKEFKKPKGYDLVNLTMNRSIK
jgi:DNA-binding transcriptional regulator GbsR (MarR family)